MESAAPKGLVVDGVDWLPSGARSGLIRVRGRWEGQPAGLPELLVEHEGTEHRHKSLPDPRAERDLGNWRGAYVVHCDLVELSGDRMSLVFPGGARVALSRPHEGLEPAPARRVPPEEPGGDVVDRSVLAERRARRAEAAEQAQARIAREALRAVEVLELRAAELEERLEATIAERDALADRRQDPPERSPELEDRIAEAERSAALAEESLAEAEERAALAAADAEALRAELAQQAPAPEGDRLQAALSAAVAQIASLRMELHEARLRRREAEIRRGADAVKLSVLVAERAGLAEDARAQRRLATRLSGELQATTSAFAQELEAARDRFAERESKLVEQTDVLRHELATAEAELTAARERVTSLEAELATAKAEASRVATEELAEAVRNAAEIARDEMQAGIDRLTAELAQAEARLHEAQAARTLAEATAAAARAQRRAAQVEQASIAAAPKPAPAAPSRFITPLAARAAEQAAAAEALRKPPAEREQLVADIDRAARTLREEPTIVFPAAPPPNRIARGRETRDYPPLRGALVKLAHDDPVAAGRVLAGLLPAQWRMLEEPLDYDITINEVGTFTVRVRAGSAEVRPTTATRSKAQFHVRGDALTLAEALAGQAQKMGRFGRIRVKGGTRRARPLEQLARTDMSLEQALRAGATVDPVLALRCLAYAVPAAWTAGHDFTIAHSFDDGQTLFITARDGRGLAVGSGAPEAEPDATVTITRRAFEHLLRGDPPPLGERPSTRGDHRAVETLRGWADRARAG